MCDVLVMENYKSPLQRDNFPGWHKVNSTIITGTNPYSYTDTGMRESTQYEYKLEAVMENDVSEVLGTKKVETGSPASFGIVRLYPNPVSDIVNCVLDVSQPCEVNIAIYDISGRCVMERELEIDCQGEVEIELDTGKLSCGVYEVKVLSNAGGDKSRFVVVR